MYSRVFGLFLSLFLLFSFPLFAQTVTTRSATLLPNFSLIGNMNGRWDTSPKPSEGFLLKEIELAVQGYLDPSVKADVFMAFHNENGTTVPHVEEGYLTFLNLADDLGAKLGKKKLNFGKQNSLHPEQWAMIEAPLVMTRFLGEEGASGQGGSLDYILPLPFFTQLELGLWKADPIEVQASPNVTVFGITGPVSHARVWSSWSLTDNSELELGFSGLLGQGALSSVQTDEVSVFGTDLTLKGWGEKFNRWVSYTEAMVLNRKLGADRFSRWGGYSYFGYRWNAYWEWGARVDHVQTVDLVSTDETKLSTQLTYQLSETTKLRAEYGYDLGTKDSSVGLQMIFGLGPHSHVLQ